MYFGLNAQVREVTRWNKNDLFITKGMP